MQAMTVCYTDGKSAAYQRGQVWLKQGILYFVHASGKVEDWLPKKVESSFQANSVLLRHRETDVSFEVVTPSFIEDLHKNGFGRGPRLSATRKQVLAVALLIASLGLIVGVYKNLVPLSERLAHSISRDTERSLFHSIVGPRFFAAERCYSPAAESVMNAWIEKLDPKHESGARAILVDWDMANAFALPGGLIVFTNGLIKDSLSATELVGIMAHELEHSKHRDSLASLLRSSMATVLWAVVFGDYTGAFILDPTVVKSIGEMSFSRDVEARADQEAVKALEAAGIEALSLAAILERIAPDPTGWKRHLQVFLSHPLTSDRVASIHKISRLKTTDWVVPDADYKSLLKACESPAGS